MLAVAIAYVMQKTPYVFPIIGGRKVEHLHANIEALDVTLNEEQIEEIDSTLPFDVGFPHNMVVSDLAVSSLPILSGLNVTSSQGDGARYTILYQSAGYFEKWPRQQAIRPTSDV